MLANDGVVWKRRKVIRGVPFQEPSHKAGDHEGDERNNEPDGEANSDILE